MHECNCLLIKLSPGPVAAHHSIYKPLTEKYNACFHNPNDRPDLLLCSAGVLAPRPRPFLHRHCLCTPLSGCQCSDGESVLLHLFVNLITEKRPKWPRMAIYAQAASRLSIESYFLLLIFLLDLIVTKFSLRHNNG